MAQSQDRTIDNISIALLCFGEPVPLFFCWHDCEPNFRTMMVEITKLRVRLNSHGESELFVEDGFAAVVMNLNSTVAQRRRGKALGLRASMGKLQKSLIPNSMRRHVVTCLSFLLGRVHLNFTN